MRRSTDWEAGLAEDLQDEEFAREFLLALLDDGLELQEALGRTIRAYGIREFAACIDMAPSNLSRAIDPEQNPTQKVLERVLKPFGLRLGVAPRTPSRAA